MEPPKIRVGGQEIEVAPVSFDAALQIAPLLSAMREKTTNLEIREAMLAVVAVMLARDLPEFKKAISYRESTALLPQWRELLEWIGLELPAPGEPSGESAATS